ncbi:MAG: hypothetical protein AB7F64_05110 [Gammaproteobacteria bacterium]
MALVSDKLPPYTYLINKNEYTSCLSQGDIIKIPDEHLINFKEYFLDINSLHYGMILTQSCDLVKDEKRKPKVDYISVCLVCELQSYIQTELKKIIKSNNFSDIQFMLDAQYESLIEKLFKLINNSDVKAHFFLPEYLPFKADMVALLSISLPIKIDNYKILINNGVLSLSPAFQAKIGNIIAQLYGRVATPDLSENNWSITESRNHVKKQIDNFNIISAPNDEYKQYILKNYDTKRKDSHSHIRELIEEKTAIEKNEEWNSHKNILTKKHKDSLFHFLRDLNMIEEIKSLPDSKLRQIISEMVNTEN